jgi:membrane protein implicated in regulation of membrane protease activity
VGSLLKLALSALASGQSSMKIFTGRMAAAAALGGLAILLVLAAWGCLCAALWIGLTPSLGPVGAPLAVAGVCLLAAGILALVAWGLMRRRRPRINPELQAEALLAEAGRLINEHKGAALLVAALMGMMAGNSRRR